MSRSQAVQLVQMYDDIYPENLFEEYCELLQNDHERISKRISINGLTKIYLRKKINGCLNLKIS